MAEYNLTYEIRFADNDISIKRDDEATNGVSLETIFGKNRLTKIQNNSFYFTATIDSRCTAELYWNDEKIPNEEINEGWSLGTAVAYNVDSSVNVNKGPNAFKQTYTAYKNNVIEDYHILIILKIVDRHPTFDARGALATDNLRGRGSTGTDEGPDYMSGNIKTADNWGWNSPSSIIDKQVIPMIKQPDDSYAYEWLWQTNTGDYILDSFVVNGTPCTVPFVPTFYYDTKETGSTENSTKTTILPSGACVTIEMVRSFNNNSQRVYKVDFTKVYVDMILTAANLMAGTGSPEMVIYSLTHVKGNKVIFNNVEGVLGEIKVANAWGDKSLLFTVDDYYEKPIVSIKNIEGEDLFVAEDFEINDSNQYYVPELSLSESNRISLLNITATPMRFALKYDKGSVTNAELPGFENWYDNNNGDYYTIENSDILAVTGETPIDLTGSKLFKYWTIEGMIPDDENEGLVAPGQIFNFTSLLEYAKKNNDIYEITLIANWE